MVQIKVEADNYENAEKLIKLLQDSGLAKSVDFEDPDDLNLKAIDIIDFYKRINASNEDQRTNKLIAQADLEKEVATW